MALDGTHHPCLMKRHPSPLALVGDFSQDQREDPTLNLTFAYEQIVSIDGTATDPWQAKSWPQFELKQDWLYHINQDPQTHEP